MAGRKGGGGLIGQAFTVIVVLSCLFLFFKTPVPVGTTGLPNYLKAKSASVEAWAKSVSGGDLSRLFKGSKGLEVWIDGKLKTLGEGDGSSSGGSSSGSSSGNVASKATKQDGESAAKTLTSIKTGGDTVPYKRTEWNHWIQSGANSCWNVREEVLDQDAEKGSIVYLDKSGKETKNKSSACAVKSGVWKEPYTGATITDPKKLDIDHVIPLSYTAKHGGQAWDSKKKESYANNMKNGYHLLTTESSANRIKGDKGPSKWKPSNKAYYCDYAVDWVKIAAEWKLTLDPADVKELQSMLKTCGT